MKSQAPVSREIPCPECGHRFLKHLLPTDVSIEPNEELPKGASGILFTLVCLKCYKQIQRILDSFSKGLKDYLNWYEGWLKIG